MLQKSFFCHVYMCVCVCMYLKVFLFKLLKRETFNYKSSKLGQMKIKDQIYYYELHIGNQCNPASIDCCVKNSAYPEGDQIKSILENAFWNNMIEKVAYHHLMYFDRCNLETLENSSSEFIVLFCNKFSLLVQHDIIATDIIHE